ncbi:tektin family domain-containing protein [Phthorimaea operculella]|nr:tektin family domain-containing protein [Phthorimaea operculella]
MEVPFMFPENISQQAVFKHDVENTEDTELRGISKLDDEKTSAIHEHLPDVQVIDTSLAEQTGTRPASNRYGLNRYSLNEWKAHNEKVLDPSALVNSNKISYDNKTGIMQGVGSVAKARNENDKRIRQKARDLFRWKTEVERAAKSITEEVEKLEFERQRLKAASRTLMLPESITKECIELRTNRAIPDLVADLAEIELVKEMNLVKEVRETFTKTLKQIEDQLTINKAAKHRIEYDWCDKTMAYNCDSMNLGLTPDIVVFRPGATKFGENSAPMEYWEHFCSENILNVEAARQKSADLRGSLNAILVQGGAKLRKQADKTNLALAETAAITQTLLTNCEKTLLNVLQKIADLEKIIENLHNSIRKMDAAMKVAQTRLDNRNNWRAHGENVMDAAQIGLIGEVKIIHETVTSLRNQLKTSMDLRKDLIKKRIELENDIAAKKKTLNIDRDRCGKIRARFPTAAELAGHQN